VKRIFCLSAVFLLLGVSAFAQQDPNDPGLQDSIIISYLTLNAIPDTAKLDVFLVSDDSVCYLDMDIVNIDNEKGLSIAGVTYPNILANWALKDTIIEDGKRIRITGHGDNYPIITNCAREILCTINFKFDKYIMISPHNILVSAIDGEIHKKPLMMITNDTAQFIAAAHNGAIQILLHNFILEPNYPDVFGGTIGRTLGFMLSGDARISFKVFDLSGNKIFDDAYDLISGWHNFVITGTDDKGGKLGEGIYIYQAIMGDSVIAQRKMIYR
jgi:hypothetical protein